MATEYLYEKWKGLTRNVSPEKAEDCWLLLKQAYSEPWRHYHTLQHIYRLFLWYEEHENIIADRETVQWAIFFHDAVYRPGGSDNEEKSAALAGRVLKELDMGEDFIATVRNFIIATKDHHAAGAVAGDLAFFLDFDLGVLASEEKDYEAYVKSVRKEYGYVSDEAFGAGRTAFIRKMLQQPHIFYTKSFRAKEDRARANLTRELNEWLWHS